MKRNLKEYYLSLINELELLEENDIVKRYISIKEKLDKVNYKKIINSSDSFFLLSSFNKHMYFNDNTNRIYVYMGTFRTSNNCDIEHGPGKYRLSRNDSNAEYCQYQDIESEEVITIPISLCEQFEMNNKLSFLSNIFYKLLLVPHLQLFQ